ncbi:hypothetical protein OESDEN_04148 [Oesophagostomum dentatum]|uniref:Uncharacterized protein n=1 Tax=Oesophagostomum dentatum TaxID=61180 RepID=A0A0B1TIF9_OESDE|nr:hypothetical protein OESDEN_04148 [Oesophagostomum dentatum]
MAAKCAGAYSLAALHLEGDAFESAVAVRRLQTDDGTFSQQGAALSEGTVEEGFGECSYEEPSVLATSLTNRLSSSVGEVLHETSAIDPERCDSDFLRPLTACGGDSSRSFSFLEWVHENQARRMRSRSEWFLSPTVPSKSSSHDPDRDVFALSLSTPFTFTQEADKKNSNIEDKAPLIHKKLSKIATRVERLSQSKKGRQLLERTGSGTTTKNCSCSMSSSALPTSCVTRRRSWRVRSLKGSLAGLKTHSLDSPDPPSLSSQRCTNKAMYARPIAHSLGGETWLVEVISDEIWKKKRSMKKKH